MINHRKNFPLYLSLTFAFVICCRIIGIQHGWITNDSILYFEMAKHFSAGDFHPVDGYSWGFYPALLAVIHLAFGIGLQTAANLLIVIFFMLLVWGLMRMVSIAGGNEWTQFYAVVLLLGSGYIVGDILPMASRDLGYWALMVHAVNHLILFYQHERWKHALNWQFLALLATLFRIEGAVQWLVLPLAGFLVSHHGSNTLKRIMAPYVLLIIGGLLATMVLLFMQIGLEDLGRIREIFTGFQEIQLNITRDIVHRVGVMRDAVIGEPFHEYAWFTFLLVYFSITTLKCLSVAGWAPPLLVLVEKHTIKKSMQAVAYQVLLFWMFVSWVIGCLIIFKVNLLSGRYVALFGFVLIVFSSFAVHKMLHHWKSHLTALKKMLLLLTALIVLAGLISNVNPKSPDFYYEIDAVSYIQSRLSAGQQVLYSSAKQRFYAGVPYEGREDYDWDYLAKLIADGRIRQYAYVVIKFDDTPEDREKLESLQRQLDGFKLEKTFYGHKHRKQLLVLKRVR